MWMKTDKFFIFEWRGKDFLVEKKKIKPGKFMLTVLEKEGYL